MHGQFQGLGGLGEGWEQMLVLHPFFARTSLADPIVKHTLGVDGATFKIVSGCAGLALIFSEVRRICVDSTGVGPMLSQFGRSSRSGILRLRSTQWKASEPTAGLCLYCLIQPSAAFVSF